MSTAPLKLGVIGIIKEDLQQDFWGAMQRLADLGYQGIEMCEPLLEGDVDANLRRIADLGIKPLTISARRENLRDEFDAVLKKAQTLKVDRVSCWWGPAESREQLEQDAALYDDAGRKLADHGIRLAYHHHDHEFKTQFDGKPALDVLVNHTDPKHVGFVIDIAWAVVGGMDPAAVIRDLGPRVTSLHVKDVVDAARDADNKVAFTAVGTGVVDLTSALSAAADVGITWAVIEQDRLRNLGPWETLTLSRLQLKELGFVD